MEKVKLTERIKKHFKGDKRLKIIVMVGAIGVALLLMSNAFSSDTSANENGVNISVSAQEYTKNLEKELSDVLSKIEGAGKCSVMITMDCGVETIYATQEESSYDADDNGESHDYSMNYVILGSSSNGKEALVIKEIQPKIRGIIIVCEGGGNSNVKMSIINAVSAAFDISSTKISVQKMT